MANHIVYYTIAAIVVAGLALEEYKSYLSVNMSLIKWICFSFVTIFSAWVNSKPITTNIEKKAEIKLFVDNIAHEMKTPLHALQLELDILKKKISEVNSTVPNSPNTINGFNSIDKLIESVSILENLSFLITSAFNRSFDFFKDANEIDIFPDLQMTDIDATVFTAVSIAQHSSPSKANISVDFSGLKDDTSSHKPFYVLTDRDWILDGVFSLIMNALKQSKGINVHVIVRVHYLQNENDIDRSPEILFEVKYRSNHDVLQTDIFSADVKLNSTNSNSIKSCEVGGNELGLWCLNKRVGILSGRCSCESFHASTTSFFTIPYKANHFGNADEVVVSTIPHATQPTCILNRPTKLSVIQEEETSSTHSTNHNKRTTTNTNNSSHYDKAFADNNNNNDNFKCNKKVLVVEDSVVLQRVTSNALQRLNCDVCIAENGKVGLDMMLKEHFDLVLMDIQMPVMNGTDAVRLIRDYEASHGIAPKQYIVGVSANPSSSAITKEICDTQGFDEFFAKPFVLRNIQDILLRQDATKTMKKYYYDNTKNNDSNQ